LLVQAGRGRREQREPHGAREHSDGRVVLARRQLVGEGTVGLRDRAPARRLDAAIDVRTPRQRRQPPRRARLCCWQPLLRQRRGPGRPQAAR